VKDMLKVKSNPIRLKSRSKTPLQSMGMKMSAQPRIPNPDEEPPSIEPMSLIPREDRERREELERR